MALKSFDDFSDYRFDAHKREEVLSTVFRSLGGLKQYPPRPREKLPSSSSIDALRLVLDEAPMSPIVYIGNHPNGHGPKHGPERYLHEVYDGCSGESTYSWAKEYRVLLFRALINVIREHGLGEDGWKSVRWEVYDKYAEYIDGISYGDGWWFDSARGWLEGRLALEELEADATRGDCKSGRKYNSSLPEGD